MDLKETDILGGDVGAHWYYRSKAAAMRRLMERTPQVVLDVGAGSGFFSRDLLVRTPAREAWCVDVSYDEERDESEAGKPIRFRRSVGSLDADLLLFMDVLEHVDDDSGLLREYARKVPRGAHILITVPAFQFLWSDHDVFLDHKRRYTIPRLETAIRDAGLTVRASAYFFGLVFPAAIAARAVRRIVGGPARSQLVRHAPAVNAALAAASSLELPLMRFNKLAGLSVFALAEV